MQLRLKCHKPAISLKPKCHKNWNVTTTEMSLTLECRKKGNVTKTGVTKIINFTQTEMPLKLKSP